MQAVVLRSEQINLRLSADEVTRLNQLAEHYALSPQSVLRMLLKRASDELAATVPPAKPSRPRVKR